MLTQAYCLLLASRLDPRLPFSVAERGNLNKKFLCAGVALFLKISRVKHTHLVRRDRVSLLTGTGVNVKEACPSDR